MFGPENDTHRPQQFSNKKVLEIARSHNLDVSSLEKSLDPKFILEISNSELENAGIVAARVVQKLTTKQLTPGQSMELLSFGIDCLTQVAPSYYQNKDFGERLITLTHVQEAFAKIIASANSRGKLDDLPELAEKVLKFGRQMIVPQ